MKCSAVQPGAAWSIAEQRRRVARIGSDGREGCNLTIPEMYTDKGVPTNLTKAIGFYREANKGYKFVEEDGRLKAIKRRQFTHLKDALKFLTTSPNSSVQQTSVIADMRKSARASVGKSKFENLI